MTSAVIDFELKKLSALASNPTHYQNKIKQAQEQDREEDVILNTLTPCSTSRLESVKEKLPGLDTLALKQMNSDQFFNPAFMSATLCVTDAIIYAMPYQSGTLSQTDKIRTWIKNLKQIGADSAYGYAMSGGLDDTGGMFIVKAPRDVDVDRLAHELVVGIFGTNKIREQIPGFAMIYGGFKCNPPVIDSETKKVVSLCGPGIGSKTKPVTHVLYENIDPSVPASKYVATCSVPEFHSMLVQVCLTTQTGSEVCDWTHNDLHSDNVLLRQVKTVPEFQIMFQTKRGTEYVDSNRIATIIDYGNAHIIHNGRHYGFYGLEEYGVKYDAGWPIYDIYKFFMFCARDAYEAKNMKVFEECRRLFQYWNKEEKLEDCLAKQWIHRYAMPYSEATKHFSISGFIDFMGDLKGIMSKGTPFGKIPLLHCDDTCITFIGAEEKVGLGTQKIPTTFFGLADFISTRHRKESKSPESEDPKLREVINNFDYGSAYAKHVAETQKILDGIKKTYSMYTEVDLRTMKPDSIVTYPVMNSVKTMYIRLSELADLLQKLKLNIKLVEDITGIYDKQEDKKQFLSATKQIVNDADSIIKNGRDIVYSNNQIINTIVADREFQNYVRNDERLSWYNLGRLQFL